MKFEKPQPGNPHNLTIRQHVIPVRTIERFAAPDGMVEVNIGAGNRVERLKPNAGIFWTRRTWNERAERGYMKQIEDKFQSLADRVISGELTQVSKEAEHDVSQFYSLWYYRSRVQPPEVIAHLGDCWRLQAAPSV